MSYGSIHKGLVSQQLINSDSENFELGLNTLKTIFDCPIHLSYQNDKFNTNVDGINYHQFCGPHPAGLASTHISAIDPVNINKVAWAVGYQDIISIGHLILTQRDRTIKNSF
jgi:Na+-transporting NADH:ubiquinone oxidoreductase subunit A